MKVFLSATQSLFLFFAALASAVCFPGVVLASAICIWFAGVAPVRGGTYFLCRRKESKQRKRAHTASPCDCPRALNVPALRAAARLRRFVANASNRYITRFRHPYHTNSCQTIAAPLRQTVCRPSRSPRWRMDRFDKLVTRHTTMVSCAARRPTYVCRIGARAIRRGELDRTGTKWVRH